MRESANSTLTIKGDYHIEDEDLNIYTDRNIDQIEKLIVTRNTSGKANLNIWESSTNDSEDKCRSDIYDGHAASGSAEVLYGVTCRKAVTVIPMSMLMLARMIDSD